MVAINQQVPNYLISTANTLNTHGKTTPRQLPYHAKRSDYVPTQAASWGPRGHQEQNSATHAR